MRIYRATRQDVVYTLKNGKSRNLRFFRLLTSPNTTKTTVSFIVSKKVAKKAIDRNKIKRRGMAIMRQILKDKPEAVEKSKNYTFLANNLVKQALFKEVKEDIQSIFS